MGVCSKLAAGLCTSSNLASMELFRVCYADGRYIIGHWQSLFHEERIRIDDRRSNCWQVDEALLKIANIGLICHLRSGIESMAYS